MSSQRVAVIAGMRTPFVKAGTVFKDQTFQSLGAEVLKTLVEKQSVDIDRLDEFIFSTVLLDPRTPNWAREILFRSGLPKTISAHSVSNNCISGLLAITTAAERIAAGRSRSAIAGGAESMSNPPLLFSAEASKKFLALGRARTLGERLKIFTRFSPRDFKPVPPGVKEPSTGLTMGEHMELSARQFGITRAEQDEIALASHQNAERAWQQGLFEGQIAEVRGVKQDNLIRSDTSLERLAKLSAVFDRSAEGTITAGNSSPLTDGASAVWLLSESEAREQGREPLAFIRDYEYAAIDPADGLLLAPAVAVPRLLKRQGLRLEEIDLIEVHEAFAATVVATLKCWREGWKEEPCGEVPKEKLNVLGGAIAVGHPFAATGARMLTSLATELKRRNLKRGLISVCAAGAMGCAMLIERG